MGKGKEGGRAMGLLGDGDLTQKVSSPATQKEVLKLRNSSLGFRIAGYRPPFDSQRGLPLRGILILGDLS